MRIKTIESGVSELSILWDSGSVSSFDWFWLRDHCDDTQSLDPITLQRTVDTFTIDPHIEPKEVRLDERNQRIEFEWSDKPQSSIGIDPLLSVLTRNGLPDQHAQSLWSTASDIASMPVHQYAEIESNPAAASNMLRDICRWGFAQIEEVPTTEDATQLLAAKVGEAQQTIFGLFWHLSAEMTDHGDSAYSTQFLSPHTDATYSYNAPGLQMFNCLEFAGTGGESTLLDGFAIAEAMREQCPDYFEILCEINVPARYLESGVHLYADRPAFRLNRLGELEQFSFNNYDRAPFVLPKAQMQAFYKAYTELSRRIHCQENWLKIPLRPGMALIFDNWRCLHGRMGYVGKRLFHGCYVDRSAFLNRLRNG